MSRLMRGLLLVVGAASFVGVTGCDWVTPVTDTLKLVTDIVNIWTTN